MKERSDFRRLTLILLTSVSAMAALSACSASKRWIDSMTNDREPQYVDGARRPPILNPQVMQPQEAAPAPRRMQAPPQQNTEAPTAPKRAPSYEQSPFDYYDNDGNRVEPEEKPVAPAPHAQAPKPAATEEASSEGNFFTRLFARKEPTAAEKLRTEPRKPLLDNPYGTSVEPAHTFVAAPMPQPQPVAAEPKMLGETHAPAPALKPVVEAPPEPAKPLTFTDSAPAPVESTEHIRPLVVKESDPVILPLAEASAPAKKPNWFERNFGSFKGKDEPKKQEVVESMSGSGSANMESSEKLSYPELSSVPPTPAQFQAVKTDKDRQMEDLQAEHMAAEQNRAALYSEPSGQDATTPVDDSAVLLGHATDPNLPPVAKPAEMTPPVVVEKPAVVEKSAPAPAPAEIPYEKAMTEKSLDKPASTDRNRWWEGWNLFSSKRQNDEAMKEAAEEQVAPANQMTPDEAAAHAPEMQPLTAIDANQPPAPVVYRDPGQQPLPALVPSAPAVSESKEAEQVVSAEEEKPAANESGLPSPDILQDVKTLPPSRYQTRERALPHSPQPY